MVIENVKIHKQREKLNLEKQKRISVQFIDNFNIYENLCQIFLGLFYIRGKLSKFKSFFNLIEKINVPIIKMEELLKLILIRIYGD